LGSAKKRIPALAPVNRVRTLVGVLLVVLILTPLAAWAVRGLRRFTGATAEGARSTVHVFAEGLIVLAAIVLGVILVVAIASSE
jgi:hypothetical protein